MLVLTRKLGQRLIIDDNVVVTVLSIRNGQVRIGIEAPRSVPIKREEITLDREFSAESRELAHSEAV